MPTTYKFILETASADMEMNSVTVTQEILAFIQRELVLGDTVLDEYSELFSSGLLDSLSLVDLIVHINHTYKLDVPPSDIRLETFNTPNAIAVYIVARIK